MKNTQRKKRAGKPKEVARVQTTMRLNPELLDLARETAELHHTTVTTIIEQCLEAGVPRLRKLHTEFRE